MKKLMCACILTVASLTAFSWGATGHRVTGYIANKYLSKKARKAIDRILEGQSLAMASTWMDEVRSDSTYNYMTDWHWVTIPDGMTYEESAKNPNGDIIQTLERVIEELKSKKLSPQQEREYVKILIHLVGDIHQPLHVGRPDRGGNDIKVTWFRSDTNLHSVWDDGMIDGTKLSYTELAESLLPPAPEELAAWQKSTVREWATESMTYRKQIYEIGNGRLWYEYGYKNLPAARLRLQQAGVRLATVLNEIFGK
ncbi:S1/P1 nuclease [Oscillatoria amoena NRMC-F 0135]|nr:S1/P1 nuclease [Oscillatoria amoena NRMC-F 0135]